MRAFLFIRNHTPAIALSRAAIPPMTPPTIAPTFVFFLLLTWKVSGLPLLVGTEKVGTVIDGTVMEGIEYVGIEYVGIEYVGIEYVGVEKVIDGGVVDPDPAVPAVFNDKLEAVTSGGLFAAIASAVLTLKLLPMETFW